ncbi:MAG: portal protein, partial [Candidatus Caldatribacteriota bacterium]
MVKKKQSPLLGNIGDRLQEVLKHHLRLTNDNLIYDEVGKKLDLTKIVPPADLSRILQVMGTTGYGGVSLFEKFFDLTMGRAGRYSEYEQMIYRIPEASQALQIYVDSILAPNVGNRDNQISFDSFGTSKVSDVGLELADSIFRQTGFYDILPQIVHTTILYGDCFLELDKTSSGIRYILHAPKNVTLLYDEKTDIELGLLIQQTSDQSNILKMLSYVYPSLSIPAPPRVVSVVSNVVSKNPPSKAELKTAEHQIEELLKDLIKDYGAAYKFLPPSKYVKFSLFYNNMYYPYGTSILDSIRSVSKQLLLIESALAIYRATRTPLRTLWTVEVGSTPEDQISGLVNGIMNRVRRQRVIDPDSEGGTSIDSIPELMSLEEDIWTPSINGSSLIKAEPINPADTSAYIDDVEYFKRKILAGLGIPPAYLASEQGASTRALLTLEDIRFSRTIKKHQIDFNNTLNALINNCFIILNKAELVNSVKVSL